MSLRTLWWRACYCVAWPFRRRDARWRARHAWVWWTQRDLDDEFRPTDGGSR